MEKWESTIDKIYEDTNESSMARRTKKALNSIASGNFDQQDSDKYYSPLKNWTEAFAGSIHCEAIVAIRNYNAVGPERWDNHKPKFGVSKPCCDGCSLLLNSITSHKSCSTYRGDSHKTVGVSRSFPCIPCMHIAVFYAFHVGLLVLCWSMGLIPIDPTDRSSCFLSFSTVLIKRL